MIRSAPVTSEAAVTLQQQSTIGIRMILKSYLMFAVYLSITSSLAISSPLSEEFELQFYGTMLRDVIGEAKENKKEGEMMSSTKL